MDMRRIVIIVMLWQTWSMMGMAQVSFGNATMFNDGWLFMLGADSAAVNDDFNDTSWRHLTLPHDWSIEGIPSPTLASSKLSALIDTALRLAVTLLLLANQA